MAVDRPKVDARREPELALIKEAHQRRRRRRLLAGGAFLAAVAVIVLVFGLLT